MEAVAHQRLQPAASDEESDGFAEGLAGGLRRDDAGGLRRQLRVVRVMSAASVLVGLASSAMAVSVLLRQETQASVSPFDAVGLSASRGKGWYRTYLDGQVRREESMDSETVDVIQKNTLVYVAETRGRRARVVHPLKGWLSLETKDGIVILRPDITYKAGLNNSQIQEVFQSAEVKEATERLKEVSLKLSGVEQKLLDSLKKLKNVPRHVEEKMNERWPGFAQDSQKAGEKLAQHATHVVDKVMKPEGAKKLLNGVSKNEHVKRTMGNHRLKGIIDQVEKQAKGVQRTQQQMAEFETSLRGASDRVGRVVGV